MVPFAHRTDSYLGQADDHADGDVQSVVEQHVQHVVRMIGVCRAARQTEQRPLPQRRPAAHRTEPFVTVLPYFVVRTIGVRRAARQSEQAPLPKRRPAACKTELFVMVMQHHVVRMVGVRRAARQRQQRPLPQRRPPVRISYTVFASLLPFHRTLRKSRRPPAPAAPVAAAASGCTHRFLV